MVILCPSERHCELGRASPPPPCAPSQMVAGCTEPPTRPAPKEIGECHTESRAPRRARAPNVPRQLEVLLRFFIGVEINGRYYDGMEVG